MARTTSPVGRKRNSAPAWKKISVVLSAPVAMILVIQLFHANKWPGLVFLVVLVAVAVAAVWLVSKLLGVKLSLGSWD